MARSEMREPIELAKGYDAASSGSGAHSFGRSFMVIMFALLGFGCAAYSLIVYSTHSGTPFFAVWLALAAFLFMGAWGVHAGWWELLPGVAKWVIRIAVGLVLAWLFATQAFAISGFDASSEFNETAEFSENDGADYLIVLGAQVRSSGLSIVLQNRLDAAIDYLDEHPHTKCIVSGGQGPNEPEPEARAMARYLEEHGVDASRIAVEDQSHNTMQNIVYSKSYLNVEKDRVCIVTNNFHVFRGVALARKQGYNHVVGLAAYSNPFFLPNNMLRESFGITKDFLTGNL